MDLIIYRPRSQFVPMVEKIRCRDMTHASTDTLALDCWALSGCGNFGAAYVAVIGADCVCLGSSETFAAATAAAAGPVEVDHQLHLLQSRPATRE